MLTTKRGAAAPLRRHRLARTDAEDLVITTITRHADALLRTARRHSLCADDANDAYQRSLEIFMRHAERLDPERAASWLHTVCKHEAMLVRRQRQRYLGPEEFDAEALEARAGDSPEEHAATMDDVGRAAEALQGLKPQEVRALWLRMEGRSYKEIAELTGWTYTKVNRCVTEGRRAFASRYAGIESGAECARLEPSLSALLDGELKAERAVELRRHLRGCGGCRTTLRALRGGDRALQGVLPVGLVVGVAGGGDVAANVFVRVYETVSGALQERVALLTVKAQTLVDAAGATKVVAVAGAAATVAAGGAATADRAAGDEPRRTAPVVVGRTAATTPSAIPAAATISAGATTATVRTTTTTATTTAARTATAKPRRQARRTTTAEREEFGVEGGATAATPAPAPTRASTATTAAPAAPKAPARTTASGGGGDEFSPEG